MKSPRGGPGGCGAPGPGVGTGRCPRCWSPGGRSGSESGPGAGVGHPRYPSPPRSLLVHGTGGFGGARQPPLGALVQRLMEQPHRLSGNRFAARVPWPIKC